MSWVVLKPFKTLAVRSLSDIKHTWNALVFSNLIKYSCSFIKQYLKHCAYSRISVTSSRKYFVHLNWIKLANNTSRLDSSKAGAESYMHEDASSKTIFRRIQLMGA
jgi:hypothetical protein